MANLTSVTDYMLPVSSETFVDNLSSGIGAGANIVPVNSLSVYADGDSVVLTVDPGTAKQATFIGQKQGANIVNCLWTEGNIGSSHDAGATVIDYDSATHYNVVTKLLRTIATQSGVIKQAALTASMGVSSVASLINPVGTISQFAGITAPSGWLMCDGSNISRTLYADLFNVISPSIGAVTITIANPAVGTLTGHNLKTGDPIHLTTTGTLPTGLSSTSQFYVIKIDANTFKFATTLANALSNTAITTTGSQSGVHTLRYNPYGIGDGATTFGVPDMKGRVPVGMDTDDTDFNTLGKRGGQKDMQKHSHTLSNDTVTGALAVNGGGSGWTRFVGSGNGGSTQTVGSGVNNMNPYVTLNYIIKS